jgi:hypothetical protein
MVLLHMLKAIDDISKEFDSIEFHQQLLRHVGLIQKESKAGALIDTDREQIMDFCENLSGTYNEICLH